MDFTISPICFANTDSIYTDLTKLRGYNAKLSIKENAPFIESFQQKINTFAKSLNSDITFESEETLESFYAPQCKNRYITLTIKKLPENEEPISNTLINKIIKHPQEYLDYINTHFNMSVHNFKFHRLPKKFIPLVSICSFLVV